MNQLLNEDENIWADELNKNKTDLVFFRSSTIRQPFANRSPTVRQPFALVLY